MPVAGIALRTIRDGTDGTEALEVPLVGQTLLDCALLNKGTAFSEGERHELGLLGLLPPHVETLEEPATRAYEEYGEKDADLERHWWTPRCGRRTMHS
jgi:malate dehydrogenase (oxaloacetate-decarboxylating)